MAIHHRWLSKQSHKTNSNRKFRHVHYHQCHRVMYRDPYDMKAKEIRMAMLGDKHIGIQSKLVLHNWLSTKAKVHKDMLPHFSFRDEIVMMHGIVMKAEKY